MRPCGPYHCRHTEERRPFCRHLKRQQACREQLEDSGNRWTQLQCEGQYLASDLDGLEPMWEVRMSSIRVKCVWLKWWEEIKDTGCKANVFSSGGFLRQGGACGACEVAPLLGETQGWVRLSLTPTEEVDNFRKGLDSVLIGPFRQSDWSSVSQCGKASGLEWFRCILPGHTDGGK